VVSFLSRSRCTELNRSTRAEKERSCLNESWQQEYSQLEFAIAFGHENLLLSIYQSQGYRKLEGGYVVMNSNA